MNAVILAEDGRRDPKANWTRAVATPDGWCFVIPNTSNTNSYGYLYNEQITSYERAKENFEKLFKVKSNYQFKFNQYIAKTPIINNRIILGGNRLFFLEPMEATAIAAYLNWTRKVWDWIIDDIATPEQITSKFYKYINETKTFINWHYMYGSKYDTPFWKYANRLVSIEDPLFHKMLEQVKNSSMVELTNQSREVYGQWDAYSFKYWYDGMTKEENGSK